MIGSLIAMSIVTLPVDAKRLLVYRRILADEYSDKKALELQLFGKLHIISTIRYNIK